MSEGARGAEESEERGAGLDTLLEAEPLSEELQLPLHVTAVRRGTLSLWASFEQIPHPPAFSL